MTFLKPFVKGLFALACLIAALAGVGAVLYDARSAVGYATFGSLTILFCLSALAAFLKARWLRRLAYVFLLLFVPCFLFDTLTDSESGLAALSRQIDGRSKLAVIEEARRAGQDVYPATLSTMFFKNLPVVDGRSILPLSGLAKAQTILCQEAGGWASYQSDRHGFNNPDAVWDQATHIAILGDSFVHGACLGPEQIFPALVRQAFPGTVNLGMSDNGPLLMLASLTEYLPLTSPKAVVWSYYEGNDLYRRSRNTYWRGDLDHEQEEPTLMAYLESGTTQTLTKHETALMAFLRDWLDQQVRIMTAQEAKSDPWRQTWKIWRQRLTLQRVLALVKSRFLAADMDGLLLRERGRLERDAKGIDSDLALFERILDKAHRDIASRGAQPIFLYLPSVEAFIRPGGGHPLKGRVLSAARATGFAVVDIEAEMRKAAHPESFYAFGARGGHFSPQGHALVAETLLRAMANPAF